MVVSWFTTKLCPGVLLKFGVSVMALMRRSTSRSWVTGTLALLLPVFPSTAPPVIFAPGFGMVSVVDAVLDDSAGGVMTKLIGVAAPTVNVPKLQISTEVPALKLLPGPQATGCPPTNALLAGELG